MTLTSPVSICTGVCTGTGTGTAAWLEAAQIAALELALLSDDDGPAAASGTARKRGSSHRPVDLRGLSGLLHRRPELHGVSVADQLDESVRWSV